MILDTMTDDDMIERLRRADELDLRAAIAVGQRDGEAWARLTAHRRDFEFLEELEEVEELGDEGVGRFKRVIAVTLPDEARAFEERYIEAFTRAALDVWHRIEERYYTS